MLVTDREVAGGTERLLEKVASAVEGGVNIVQLRDKDLPHDELMPLVESLRQAIGDRAKLVLNRPPVTALKAQADGVHLPEDAETPEEWPRRLLIGRSVHSLASARRAEADGTDYVAFGPIYETRSHSGAPAMGSQALREVIQAVSIPVVAIGGITLGSVPELVSAGASGVAVIRAVLDAADPRAAAEALRDALTVERLTA
jgi:thiamine-phosphate pyrophosphorylase